MSSAVAYGLTLGLLVLSIFFIILSDEVGPGNTLTGGVGLIASILAGLGIYTVFGPPQYPNRVMVWFGVSVLVTVSLTIVIYSVRSIVE